MIILILLHLLILYMRLKSEHEYIDEQNVSFLENIIVDYQNLIEKYLKTRVFDSQQSKIDLLSEEKINYLEKIKFLKSKFNISLRLF